MGAQGRTYPPSHPRGKEMQLPDPEGAIAHPLVGCINNAPAYYSSVSIGERRTYVILNSLFLFDEIEDLKISLILKYNK